MTLRQELTAAADDLATSSREHALAVMFPKSKASVYPALVAVCKGADAYWERLTEGVEHHFACFGRSPAQITMALAAVNYSGAIRAVRFFAKGFPIVDTHYLYESLKCYVQSLSCDDRRAHCVRLVKLPDGTPGEYLFPCNFLIRRQPKLDLNAGHPASLRDQVQAMAVYHGCDWCPNFDADEFRPVQLTIK